MNPDPAEKEGPVFECESEMLWIWEIINKHKERQRGREQHSDPFISEADPAGTKKLFIK